MFSDAIMGSPSRKSCVLRFAAARTVSAASRGFIVPATRSSVMSLPFGQRAASRGRGKEDDLPQAPGVKGPPRSFRPEPGHGWRRRAGQGDAVRAEGALAGGLEESGHADADE